jgi:hypothetical protein
MVSSEVGEIAARIKWTAQAGRGINAYRVTLPTEALDPSDRTCSSEREAASRASITAARTAAFAAEPALAIAEDAAAVAVSATTPATMVREPQSRLLPSGSLCDLLLKILSSVGRCSRRRGSGQSGSGMLLPGRSSLVEGCCIPAIVQHDAAA